MYRHNCATFRSLRTCRTTSQNEGVSRPVRTCVVTSNCSPFKKKPSDMKRILPSTLTSLRRASGTLSMFTSDRPHTTLRAWGFHSSGFHKFDLLGSNAVSGSRRFGNDLVFIVRTQQYSAAVIRRQLLCHQCITDNINSSLQARQFSSYESDGWLKL